MRMLLAPMVLALSLAFAASAAAGGWAVTTLDQLPDSFVAGQVYELGWTIRQHGQTPIDVECFSPGGASTAIRATSGAGQQVSFTGARIGPTGHYVTKVSFPTAGDWTWLVTQGPFADQPLGTITVAAAAGAASTAPPALTEPVSAHAPAPAPDPLRLALPFATGAALALFAALLALHLKGGRATRIA